MAKDVTDSSFDADVLEVSKSKPVLVDFWAIWCGPCQMMTPILEELSSEVADTAEIVKVNVDEAPDLAQKYGIQGIPALKIFRNGEIVEEFTGVTEKDALKTSLEKHA